MNSSAPRCPSLIAAVLKGDVSSVTAALARGASPDEETPEGTPALVLAAVKGDSEMVRALLESGADPDRADRRGGMRPLHAAATYGKEEIARSLIEHGVDVDAVIGDTRLTPLAVAVRKGFAELAIALLSAGADPNVSVSADSEGEEEAGTTALLLATTRDDLKMVDALLAHGANPDIPKADGMTPMLTAVLNSSFPIVQRLCESGAAVNTVSSRDEGAFTALDVAEARAHEPITEYLRSKGAVRANELH